MTATKGRASKLTPESQERAASVLRETGVDKFAYTAIGISRALFYKWKKEHPEFREAMDAARRDFDEGRSENANAEIAQAKGFLLKCLAGEQFQVTTIERKRRLRTERQNNDEVEVVSETEDWVVETEVKKVQVLPPAWYLERLYTGGQEKKEFTIKVGVATTPQPEETFLEIEDDSAIEAQEDYDHFDEDNER